MVQPQRQVCQISASLLCIRYHCYLCFVLLLYRADTARSMSGQRASATRVPIKHPSPPLHRSHVPRLYPPFQHPDWYKRRRQPFALRLPRARQQ